LSWPFLPRLYPVHGQSHGQLFVRKQPAGIGFAANLNDPADIGHPAPFRVSAPLLPNNEESNKDADQQRYQKELTHEDRLMLIWDRTLRAGSSGHKQDTGGKWQAIEPFWDILPIDKQCPQLSDAGLCPSVNSKNQQPDKKTTDLRLRENYRELSGGSSSTDRLGGLHRLYDRAAEDNFIAPTPKPAHSDFPRLDHIVAVSERHFCPGLCSLSPRGSHASRLGKGTPVGRICSANAGGVISPDRLDGLHHCTTGPPMLKLLTPRPHACPVLNERDKHTLGTCSSALGRDVLAPRPKEILL